jgi:hypothetical protein
MKHHPDVLMMMKVAMYQHPQKFKFAYAIPNVDFNELLMARLKAEAHSIYCLPTAPHLQKLEEISDLISKFGPDMSLMRPYEHLDFIEYENPNESEHQILHERIHDAFISTQYA